MVDSILRQRPNTNIKDNHGETPVFIATRNQDLPLVQVIP
jgi:hypothetical protein